jgi:hypothetical protein
VLTLLALILSRRKLHKKTYVSSMEKSEIDLDVTLKLLKENAEKQLINMDKIARFRDLTESEKVLYMHCRSILK